MFVYFSVAFVVHIHPYTALPTVSLLLIRYLLFDTVYHRLCVLWFVVYLSVFWTRVVRLWGQIPKHLPPHNRIIYRHLCRRCFPTFIASTPDRLNEFIDSDYQKLRNTSFSFSIANVTVSKALVISKAHCPSRDINPSCPSCCDTTIVAGFPSFTFY